MILILCAHLYNYRTQMPDNPHVNSWETWSLNLDTLSLDKPGEEGVFMRVRRITSDAEPGVAEAKLNTNAEDDNYGERVSFDFGESSTSGRPPLDLLDMVSSFAPSSIPIFDTLDDDLAYLPR